MHTEQAIMSLYSTCTVLAGYSAAGEVLVCDIYAVGTHAAIELQADKIFTMTLPSTMPLQLPQWLPLSDAQRLLTSIAEMHSEQGGNGAHTRLLPVLSKCCQVLHSWMLVLW